MTILRERLLDRVECRVDSGSARKLMREAADQIFDLETALRNALSVIDEYGWFDENGNDYAIVKAAREALEAAGSGSRTTPPNQEKT